MFAGGGEVGCGGRVVRRVFGCLGGSAFGAAERRATDDGGEVAREEGFAGGDGCADLSFVSFYNTQIRPMEIGV